MALDDELNVFTRDNENDGGDYLLRVYHCLHGSDHGYPYLYYERPHEAMPPLADLGRGSSAGGVCYLETAFPPASICRTAFNPAAPCFSNASCASIRSAWLSESSPVVSRPASFGGSVGAMR